ncbi:hypothetical protein [Lacinutrix sp. Hel_I_90]|uniref:hypothetical protein n=1 Tax=Lacinutrix sp. Hel_I_90 TaxID=1249999 RepID=UPI000ACEA59E|nr:hypothetical protein [Lacinutrix sp. Hel_I_90]
MNTIKHHCKLPHKNKIFSHNPMTFMLLILGLSLTDICLAQTKITDSSKVKSDNFLDMGAESMTQMFGENLDGNATGKKTGFLELLGKMDLTEEQKADYKSQYYLQANTLTQKQKDSLAKAIERKILEAKSIKD